MKIAFLISSLTYGGAERQLLALCKGLMSAGIEITVGCLKDDTDLLQTFLSNQIPVHQFHMRGPIDPRALLRVRNWLRRESPTLLHTHLFKADIYGAFAAGLCKVPVVCTKWNFDLYLKNPLFGWLGRASAANCKRVIAISNAVRQFLVNTIRFHSDKVLVIPLGASNMPVREVRFPAGDALRIGIVARLTEQKGHEVLLHSFAKTLKEFKSLTLHIYGDGPLKKYLHGLVNRLHLKDSVRFEGVHLEPQEIYPNLDLVILPSLWEGAGLVLLEAMANGIPLIASAVGGIPEYVTPDCCMLVPANDCAALAEAIARMARNSDLRKRMSEGGIERVKQFGLEQMIQAHISLYKQISESV